MLNGREGKLQRHTQNPQGNVEIELMPGIAPLAVANFVGHIESGYYNDLIFHRVIEGFMVQGDPLGNGTGGESIWGKNFPDEFSPQARFDTEGLKRWPIRVR